MNKLSEDYSEEFAKTAHDLGIDPADYIDEELDIFNDLFEDGQDKMKRQMNEIFGKYLDDIGHLSYLGLPEQVIAYHEAIGKYVRIKRGKMGYWQIRSITPDFAKLQNKADGVTSAEQIEAMLHGSMFGWHTSLANPTNWTADKCEAKIRELV